MECDLRSLLNFINSVNIPTAETKIYKDECVFSHDTPFSKTGLYVCLKTFQGVGESHLLRHHLKEGGNIYLHLLYIRHGTEKSSNKKPTRLAIGIKGGFDNVTKLGYTKHYSVVIVPYLQFYPWPNEEFPPKLSSVIEMIITAEPASRLTELELNTAWDGEKRIISRFADNLIQLDNGKTIPPKGWKCEQCSLTTNLWLNLTDGSILCGRRFFDGSGGNDHALIHYKHTGFPLAVKLGTITKDGKGDVYSYSEDDMVEDPYLVAHLAHFGINVTTMKKSDKSMIELELDLNQRQGEWVAMQEQGRTLLPLYGPGYTGLMNLGNLCYLNSTMQVIFALPEFIEKYVDVNDAIFNSLFVRNPVEDFNTQMAKLGTDLNSGKYSKPPTFDWEITSAISPATFKYVIGRGHSSFSTKTQQDAQEFFLHVLEVVKQNSEKDPGNCFKFQLEERFQCASSNKVKYVIREDACLPLHIPLEEAINKEEVEAYQELCALNAAQGIRMNPDEVSRPRVLFQSCLNNFSETEEIEFYSAAIKAKTTAFKTTRLATFPRYLLLHFKKYYLKSDWTPSKMDVEIIMPETIDLSSLKGFGLQPGEELLSQDDDDDVVCNEQNLSYLLDMGFKREVCKKALRVANNDLVAATNWLMENPEILSMDIEPTDEVPLNDPKIDDNVVMNLIAFGFDHDRVLLALRENGYDADRAADWLFNHPVMSADASDVQMPAEVSAGHAGSSSSEIGDSYCMQDHTYDADSGPSTQKKAKTGEHEETPRREQTANVNPDNDRAGPSSELDEFLVTKQSRRDEVFYYQMKAFISHMGPAVTTGHYVCHIRHGDKWVIYNDEKVSLSENPPLGLGYLYVYERIVKPSTTAAE